MAQQPVGHPWPKSFSFHDKLQRLALLSPTHMRALEVLVDDVLDRLWPRKIKRRHVRRAS